LIGFDIQFELDWETSALVQRANVKLDDQNPCMISPSLPEGIGFHSIGAVLSANCYAPQKRVRRWSWEVFWIAQAWWCWLILPVLCALLTIPHLGQVIRHSPSMPMLFAFLMGIAYGIGGTCFNISIRYIGFSLTYSIAVGLSSILGTLVPPMVQGQVGTILARPGSQWVLTGIAAGALGIAICGVAGRMKERNLEATLGRPAEFSLARGLVLSLVAGIFSAVYGLALEVAAPIADLAEQYGAGVWKGNVSYIFVNAGAFLTAVGYSLYLAKRNSSITQLVRLPPDAGPHRVAKNHLFALITGTLWFGQFFFYNLGHVHLGKQYAFCSWAIHMIMLVMASSLLGIAFKEWKGCSAGTHATIATGVAVLAAAILLLTLGNYLGGVSG
jgi:L-rhamnose-H+ transport protein